jgi:hypothetical protein
MARRGGPVWRGTLWSVAMAWDGACWQVGKAWDGGGSGSREDTGWRGRSPWRVLARCGLQRLVERGSTVAARCGSSQGKRGRGMAWTVARGGEVRGGWVRFVGKGGQGAARAGRGGVVVLRGHGGA